MERKSGPKKDNNITAKRLSHLQQRLEELEQTLSAIQNGEVDALVVDRGSGEEVYTLKSAEYPYRVMIEQMAEGALRVSPDGVILYCNESFARMVRSRVEDVLATPISRYIVPSSLRQFQRLIETSGRGEIAILATDETPVWSYMAANVVREDGIQDYALTVTDLTEHMRAEKIMASEKFARILLEQAPDAILVADAGGMIIRASEKAHTLLGESLSGRQLDQALEQLRTGLGRGIPESDNQPLGFAAIRDAEVPSETEVAMVTDGKVVCNLMLSYSRISEGNTVLGYSISLLDITKAKQREEEMQTLVEELKVQQEELKSQTEGLRQAQQEVKETRDKYIDLYDHAPVGYMTLAMDGQILEANQTAARLLALEKNDLSRFRLTGFIAAEDKGAFYDHLKRVRDADSRQKLETLMQPLEGWQFPAEMESIAVRDNQGNLKEIRTTISDITARKRAESEALRLSERRRLLHELSLRVVSEKNLDSLLSQVADAARALTGARISACGHGFVDGQFVIGGSSREDGYAPCPPHGQFRIEKGGIYMGLINARSSLRLTEAEMKQHPAWWGVPEGHINLRGFLGASLFDAEGKPSGLIAVSDKSSGEDLTVEDEDFLVQLASIASLAIQHIQARSAVEQQATELEAANKELEAFSYSVSHDLRAPLRALDGFSEMVIEEYRDGLDEKAQDYLNRVRRASQRMSDLIDDMLKLSQITRADMYRDELNLSRIVQTIIEELQARQHERKVEFIIAPDATADGDLQLISIALRNLLENAWKFTGKCPQPRIQFGALSQNGERVFFIKDNGAGFDMKDADKLFKAFQRLHTAEEYEGTGIGLAIVQRIVRRHGGRIWVEAARGQGATFYFTLG